MKKAFSPTPLTLLPFRFYISSVITLIATSISLLLLLVLPAGFSYLCGLLALSLVVGFGTGILYLVMVAEVLLLLLSMWKQTRSALSLLLPFTVSLLPLAYFRNPHMILFSVSLVAVSLMQKNRYLTYSKALSTSVVFAFYISQQYYLSIVITAIFTLLFFLVGLLLSRPRRYN